jgi:mannose/fructose/sorbose-specific phosphotransferase system IIA component
MVIVTHGDLAAGLLHAGRMIIGELPAAMAISIQEGQSPDELQAQLENALVKVDQGDGILIFVDILGATPFNVSAQIAALKDDVEVITGANLAMILETALQRETQSFDELVEIAVHTGRSSVDSLTNLLKGNS